MTTSTPFIKPEHLNGVAFDGGWKSLGRMQETVEPASGKTLGKIAMATAQDIAAAATMSRKAQPTWAATAYERRSEILRNAARIAENNRDEIVDWIVRESGSTVPKAAFEVALTIKALFEASAMPSQAAGQVLPTQPGRLNLARRRAIGVVGVISPFNFPLYLAMRAIAPAIAVGNGVVLKPDPRTAICGGHVIARLFEEAGLPTGILSVLPGDGEAGAALCNAPDIGMIQFTGSTAAGRRVGEAAGRNLKKVSLELGGKNSFIVLDDADLDLAVKNAVWSTYLHQGQICMSAGRILVQAGIAQEFTRRLAEHAATLTSGDPASGQVALGPLINQAQLDHAARSVEAAVTGGAKVVAGGGHDGLFFQPTVLLGVNPDNPAFHEEIFGPVAVVTVFEKDEDAIALANDTDYGLSGAIVSRSIGRALAIGERLNVGLLHINDATVNDEVINPFGGVGASGNGTSIGGPANWEEFTQWQWVTIKADAPAYPL
ncbi:benzaldehyde dehydrogenase [Agrobacterium vitis]|uniref:benzaldehyde dehydrogenase n=1 Tax=Agrobacterium vitis TaxID=373 RepID=UPI0008732EA4|nr:benzaldehyde dehydrogenase [Agrobacterium vitis]MCE6076928.1 aldehyde dehydrogenase family protein [Agrobacterium vitis]MUO71751.1 aldehyde dehydrogenase family protein [Agrobacterium vitis]MUO86171.1 aldehyde dehydrogenase family protein [Agrobacterium vitis]MVA36847.1 aldehyde dehydrogenase family protein [Agrobacterium vitis]